MNLESKRMGTKAIIKINERFCQQEEINRIAIVAPMAAVNIIKNYDVVEKRAVEVPETIEGFVRCANPKCITTWNRCALRLPSSTAMKFHSGANIARRSRIKTVSR